MNSWNGFPAKRHPQRGNKRRTDQLPDKVDKVVPCCINLEVQCSCTPPGDTVMLVGSCPELGNWKAERGLPLCTSQELYPKWTGTLEIESCAACDVQFKLAILRPSSHEWEQPRNNRNLAFPGNARFRLFLFAPIFGWKAVR